MKKFLTLVLVSALLLLAGSAWAEEAVGSTLTLNGQEAFISGIDFPGDVSINGSAEMIWFSGCTFHGNVILNAEETTKVGFQPDCVFDEGNVCIINNPVTEGNVDYSIPKYLFTAEARPVSCDGIGGVICTAAPLQVEFNGVLYNAENVQYTSGENGETLAYDGREISCFVIARWYENGEEIIFTYGE